MHTFRHIDFREAVIRMASPIPILTKASHESVDFTQWSSNVKRIYFAVATTGFIGQNGEICQIAVKSEDEENPWSVHILPDENFISEATHYNGFTLRDGNSGDKSLLKGGVQVQTLTLSEALVEFIRYVSAKAGSNHTTILLGWHSQQFHMQLLLQAMKDCRLSFRVFEDAGICYGDPHLMIKKNRENFPKIAGTSSFSLPIAYHHMFGGHPPFIIDACENITMHQSVLTSLNITSEHLKQCAFTLSSADRVRKYRIKVRRNLKSMEGRSKLYVRGRRLIDGNVITESMARKIAESGLNYRHLQRIYRKRGREGIEWILKAPQHRDNREQPRVTRCQRVIDAIVKHFEDKMARKRKCKRRNCY